jgi:hypothetical protein
VIHGGDDVEPPREHGAVILHRPRQKPVKLGELASLHPLHDPEEHLQFPFAEQVDLARRLGGAMACAWSCVRIAAIVVRSSIPVPT